MSERTTTEDALENWDKSLLVREVLKLRDEGEKWHDLVMETQEQRDVVKGERFIALKGLEMIIAYCCWPAPTPLWASSITAFATAAIDGANGPPCALCITRNRALVDDLCSTCIERVMAEAQRGA